MSKQFGIRFLRTGLLQVGWVLCLAFGPLQAVAEGPGVLAFKVDVPAGRLSAAEVREVVLRASIGRAWEVKVDADRRIVIYLNQRKNEATVTYEYDESVVTAYCEGYATNGKGVRKGPEQPTGWLSFLRKDITKGLNETAFLGRRSKS